jgi:hypothetical protein
MRFGIPSGMLLHQDPKLLATVDGREADPEEY